MKSVPGVAPTNPRQSTSVYRNGFAFILLAAVLCSSLMSWSSSRTLSFFLAGTWRSLSGEEVAIVCEGGSVWMSTCSLTSALTNFSGLVRASPLNAGGWVAVPDAVSSGAPILWYQKKELSVLTEHGNDSGRRVTYIREHVRVEGFISALHLKGKYIAALFLIVGTYKWVQVALFRAPARRVRRF
jgi:hypothetical protein